MFLIKNKFIVFFGLLSCLAGLVSASESIIGAGSSAAAPVYRIWAQEFRKSGGSEVVYEPQGSSNGMARVRQRQVDFGASDVVASKADLSRDGLVMFPTAISGVVPVVNLPRLGGTLRLSGEVLAKIFLGEITHWNNPEIAALNSQLSLPSLPIRIVGRADGSGTTHYFSDYLAKVSPAWRSRFGVSARIDWPAAVIGSKDSMEMSKVVRGTEGAIGYLDYSYVLEDKLQAVQLRNQTGRYVTATPEAFRSAVINSRWLTHGDFLASLTELPGDGSWPITMGTYVAMPKVAKDTAAAIGTIRFFTWAFGRGDALARQAKFVPLPESVQAGAFREIAMIQGAKGEAIGLDALAINRIGN